MAKEGARVKPISRRELRLFGSCWRKRSYSERAAKNVGPLLRPAPVQPAVRGQAEAESRIARQRGAGYREMIETGSRRRGVIVLPWPHDFDRMSERSEARRQRLHGQRDAIDLRGPGLGHDRYAHAAWQLLRCAEARSRV